METLRSVYLSLLFRLADWCEREVERVDPNRSLMPLDHYRRIMQPKR